MQGHTGKVRAPWCAVGRAWTLSQCHYFVPEKVVHTFWLYVTSVYPSYDSYKIFIDARRYEVHDITPFHALLQTLYTTEPILTGLHCRRRL
jgi:hypothetical protein